MYKRLIIIGNGFDRFHDIKSSYEDFKEYLSAVGKTYFVDSLERYIDSDELWSSFESALAKLDYDSLMDDNSCYMLSYSDENWKDSAHHDYQYMIENELDFSDDIPMHLKEWILSLDTKRKAILNHKLINDDSFFLNFNYTDTLEKTYAINRRNILYIHGKAKEDGRLIVGHGDKTSTKDKIKHEFSSEEEKEVYYEYMSGLDVRQLEADEIIRGYFNNTYKDVEEIIKNNKLNFEGFKGIDKVFVLGHSLADVDILYFEVLNDILGEKVSWNVTYYSEEERDSHMKQLLFAGISECQINMCKMEHLCS